MPELQRLRHSTALRLAIAAALMSITAPCFAEVTESQLAERDAENKRVTAELMAKPNELTQPLQSKYNHIITYGQSLASAAEGWPALSVAPRYDNLMLGQSPRSAAFSGASFKPVGEAAFTPLRAVVQQKSNAAVVLDAEKVGKLAPQAQEEGESVEVGALNMARRLYLHHLGRDTDPEHLFVASNASTSGRSIAQLSKTGGTNEYLRVTQAVDQAKALADAQVDMVAWEKDKVKGAIRTDFILSAEIIVLTLGVVATASFTNQLVTLAVVALAMTVFVYGLVAGIVKLDDVGLYLSRKGGAVAAFGRGLVASAPWLMKFLSVAGTIAMFLVGGGILVHNVPALHHAVQAMGGEGQWGWLVSAVGNMVVGIIAGAIVLAAVTGFQKLRGK